MIAGLLGSLVMVSGMIIAFGPAPLRKDQPTLMAVDPQALYNTQVKLKKWDTLYIHHSKTRDSGFDTQQVGDHFVIGSGQTVGDGEIVMTSGWIGQQTGAVENQAMAGGWIGICLEGDFDVTPPTPAQMKRLGQLVSELQNRFGIETNQVIVRNVDKSVEGIGKLFPKQDLAQYLKP